MDRGRFRTPGAGTRPRYPTGRQDLRIRQDQRRPARSVTAGRSDLVRHPPFLLSWFWTAFLITQAGAAHAERRFEFDLAAAPLAASLERLAAVTGSQIVYPSDLVRGRTAPAVRGHLTGTAALRRMLSGSGIRARRPSAGVVALLDGRGTAAAQREPHRATASVDPEMATRAAEMAEPDIVVTGTNLRTRDAVPPLVVVRPELAATAGATDLAGMLFALPVGYASTTEATVLAGADRSGLNYALGTAIDLRGLGRDATLVLIDGHRIAGSGDRADFTDLSLVPMAAVERIDILPDGASAIYGADAVAGVVNIVLKTQAEGAELRVLGGGATRGGLAHRRVAVRYGLGWSGGSLLLVGELDRRGALAANDRATTRSADLRPFGGSDWRSVLSSPANILSTDRPGAGPFAVHVAPADGTIAILPRINRENQNAGVDLLASQTRRLVSARVRQTLDDHVSLDGDARIAVRRFHFAGPASAAMVTVTAADPHFLSVDGATSEQLGYSFIGSLGPTRSTGQVVAFSAGLGLNADLDGDWRLDLHAGHSSEVGHGRQSNIANATRLAEALGNPVVLPTGFSAARYGWFDPYRTTANGAALMAFIGSGFAREHHASRLDTGDIELDGPIALGKDRVAHLAAGASIRRDALSSSGVAFYDGAQPQPVAGVRAARLVGSLFAELAVPLWRAASPSFRRIDLSVAVRAEHHPGFGSTLDPRLALTIAPARGIAWRTSWGTSYRAPSLAELHGASSVTPTAIADSRGAVPALVIAGGNAGLRPETAHTLSSVLTITPAASREWRLSLGVFRTRFEGRIAQPAFDALPDILQQPALRRFITVIDPARNAADLVEATRLLALSGITDGAAPAAAYRLIVDARAVNTAALLVGGIDASFGWTHRLGSGSLDVAVSATRLLTYRERLAKGAGFVERIGMTGYPSGLRARATIGWSARTFDLAIALHHVDGSRNDQGSGHAVAPFRTVDARAVWRPRGEAGPSLSIDVANLLDRPAPFADRARGFGYDAPNADLAGRVVSVELRWNW